MKLKDMMDFAVKAGIAADPRTKKEIDLILKERKDAYKKLTGFKKECFDRDSLTSPYTDTRLVHGAPSREVNEAWIGIDIATEDLLLVKKMTENTQKKPVVIAHHPVGRGRSTFEDAIGMQAYMLAEAGMPHSVADALTARRQAEIARRIAPVNEYATADAARLLDLPLMCIHTPADNHVTEFVNKLLAAKKPRLLKDLLDLFLGIEEYKISAKQGKPPKVLAGKEKNKCGKIFVDMTGGTGGDPELVKALVQSGVSTIVGMHMGEEHYKLAQKAHMNVVIAGHISSDNLGLNLLMDKMIKKLGKLNIVAFEGFRRVSR